MKVYFPTQSQHQAEFDCYFRILKIFTNADSRFSRIWFSSSSVPSQDIESPTGNLHFPQMKTTGPSSTSLFSSTSQSKFSSPAVELKLETANVVFTPFCFADFFLVAISACLSKTSRSNVRVVQKCFQLPLSSSPVFRFTGVNFDKKKNTHTLFFHYMYSCK